MSDRPARTVFLGSGQFAVPVLAALAEHPLVDLRAVVTAPPRPVGRKQELRPTPVGRWAAEHSMPAHTPARLRSSDALVGLRALEPELIVLADYGQIVPRELLELPRHGALNLHPSLLPRHRGASPIQAAILAGDDETGVTLMLMDEGLDSGPVVAQEGVRLTGSETAADLERQLAGLAAVVLNENLRLWLGGMIGPVAQSEAAATMTRPLRRGDGLLDPHRTAAELERRVRALQPWPGTYLATPDERLIVRRAAVAPTQRAAQEPGQMVRTDDDGLALVTANGLLELVEVQPVGGRAMSGAELLRGRPHWLERRATGAPGATSGS